MKKLVSCFECGFKYDRKKAIACQRCGETRIYDPRLHDENYDSARDSSRNGLILIAITLIYFALLAIMTISDWRFF
jgi:hypothetical protein